MGPVDGARVKPVDVYRAIAILKDAGVLSDKLRGIASAKMRGQLRQIFFDLPRNLAGNSPSAMNAAGVRA
jgi:hypothetical protein